MSEGWSTSSHEAIARLLRERTGLVFRASRIADAESGIERTMARKRIADRKTYLARLESSTAELDDLVAELTVGETYFFRDPTHFDFIRNEVVPSLVGISRQRLLRFWSAGCSSGEEAYSLAILLDEAGVADRAHVLATDLSKTALAKARAATYGKWSFRGVDPQIMARYFRASGVQLVLDPKIRERVQLERLNLATDPYPSHTTRTYGIDLILCRNVLIYLGEDVIREVHRRFAACLSDSGWLILGPSDPIPVAEVFEAVHVGGGVFYRRRRESPAKPPVFEPFRMPTPEPPLPAAMASEPASTFEFEEAPTVPDASVAALELRSIANTQGAEAAHREAALATRRHPTAPELHLIDGALLLELELYDEARQAARKALYLDRTLVFGHFLLGLALMRLGERPAARKALGVAHALCSALAPNAIVPFADGVAARSFLEAIATQLELLGAS